MKRIGLVLLGCSAVCLIIGAILFPSQKRLIIDVNGITTAVTWFVLSYMFGQAGLLVFISGLHSERLTALDKKISSLLPPPVDDDVRLSPGEVMKHDPVDV